MGFLGLVRIPVGVYGFEVGGNGEGTPTAKRVRQATPRSPPPPQSPTQACAHSEIAKPTESTN